ncbi:MAG TPA: hypothetical protein VEB40_00610 [Flavipsychrobacter sp.]|nr:hypothetical protein [Flavipsychrobacter sp.]
MNLSCLDNIVSIPDGCMETETSLSGFSITDLPGVTIKLGAAIADEKFVSGLNLLKDARRRAILQIRNDLLGYLHGNGYVTQSVQRTWSTLDRRDGSLKAATSLGDYRGIVVKSQRRNCGLRKLHIPYTYIKANHTGSLVLRIEDGEHSYPFSFDSVAGSISKVAVNFTAESDEVYLLLPDVLDVYSVVPNCQCGGSTTPKSDCAKVVGYYNGIETKSEGFGIWAEVQCKCEYSYLLCQLATEGLFGEVLLYKTGVNIMDERTKTDRLNYFTIYGTEEAEAIRQEWTELYNEKWNSLITSLPGLLPRLDKCGCIECGNYRAANI